MTFILLIACTIGLTESAYGYIDPGTGSLLIQALFAAITATILFGKRIVLKVQMAFVKKKNRDK